MMMSEGQRQRLGRCQALFAGTLVSELLRSAAWRCEATDGKKSGGTSSGGAFGGLPSCCSFCVKFGAAKIGVSSVSFSIAQTALLQNGCSGLYGCSGLWKM